MSFPLSSKLAATCRRFSAAAKRHADKAAVGAVVLAMSSGARADDIDTAVTAVTTKITTYGGLLLGVVVAIWGIRKGIAMWGGR